MATPSAQLYQAYGLTIRSQIPLPGLPPGVGDHDIDVAVGPLPHQLAAPVQRGVLFEAAPGSYLLRVPGAARFLASSGRSVVIDADADAEWTYVRTMLLGPVFTAILHQRGALVLHASAVASAEGALVFVGHSGLGKSTLAAALSARGFPMICDDVAAITLSDQHQPRIHRGPAQARLWVDTIARLGHDHSTLDRARRGREKFIVPLFAESSAAAMPLAQILVLGFADHVDVRITALDDRERFDLLRAHIRNRRVLEATQPPAQQFRTAAAVAAGVRMSRLSRPRQVDSLDEVIRQVEQAARL